MTLWTGFILVMANCRDVSLIPSDESLVHAGQARRKDTSIRTRKNGVYGLGSPLNNDLLCVKITKASVIAK